MDLDADKIHRILGFYIEDDVTNVLDSNQARIVGSDSSFDEIRRIFSEQGILLGVNESATVRQWMADNGIEGCLNAGNYFLKVMREHYKIKEE
ncbi:hypothetical protein [Oceanotoga phage vB_OteS-UFV02]